jgi:hypothetical protein
MAANWIQNKKAQLVNIKQLEKAIMSRPDVRAALGRYITSLNLQAQINAGKITEKQALELFNRAIQQFSYAISRQINAHFTPQLIDQNDLSNPLNMEQALNNPNSLASIQMNDTAYSIMLTINEETTENEQAQYQIQMTDQQTTEEEVQAPDAPTPIPTPEPASHEKEALLVGAVLGASLEKGAIEHTFEQYIGKDLKNAFQALEEPSEIKSPFEILAPKPKPPTSDEEK